MKITAGTPLIPRTVLFGNPVKTSPQISPDGTRISYLAPVNGVLNVWVKTIGLDDDRPVTKDTERGIRTHFWLEDNRHLAYVQDFAGNENWHLYVVNLNTNEVRDLTPFENIKVLTVDHNKHFPKDLLVLMNKEDPRLFDAYHLNVDSGQLTLVLKNPGNFIGWATDANLKVRGVLGARPDGGVDLMVRQDNGDSWKKLISWDAEDRKNSGIFGFSKEGQFIYVGDSRNVNTGRLVKVEISTGKWEVMVEDPQYDVGTVMFHPDTYEPQMVTLTKARLEWVVLDPTIKEDIETIRKLNRGDFMIISRDHADSTWIIGFTVDNSPVPFYSFDRRSKKATFLFDNQPELNRHTLSVTEPFSLESRDGLTIHGYITFPPGEKRNDLPVVLNVHGGPWVRDTWGFSPEAQWLANRGYVCLRVNYRGSTGYGKAFTNAGDKEWGGKMHNDLVDAVQWAINNGIADSKKIAIYGGSYGGYAALVGVTFTPDLFCCAVDVVGPSNLITFIKTIPPYWSVLKDDFYKRVGNPDTEEEFLKSRSPLFRVDQIKIPLLIAQGANDPRVNQAESEQIVAALKQKGVEYEYLLFPDEGHGFAKPENRLKFYAAVEKFLARHLGGRFEE